MTNEEIIMLFVGIPLIIGVIFLVSFGVTWLLFWVFAGKDK